MVEISIGKADLEAGSQKCVMANGRKLALSNIGGKYYCVDSLCTHAGGPLCEGSIEGDSVVCPWHESMFNVKTGKAVRGPAVDPIKIYSVREEGGELFVDI